MGSRAFLNCSWRAFFRSASCEYVATMATRVQYTSFAKDGTELDCARLVNVAGNIVEIHSVAPRRAAPNYYVRALEKYLLIPRCRFCKRRKSLIRLWEILPFIMEIVARRDGLRLFFPFVFPQHCARHVCYSLHVYKH